MSADQNADHEQAIRERAYAIWKEQGEPDGYHEDHWNQAIRELGDGVLPPELAPPAETGTGGAAGKDTGTAGGRI